MKEIQKNKKGQWVIPFFGWHVTLFQKFKTGIFDRFYPFTNRLSIKDEEFAFWLGVTIGEMVARGEMVYERPD